MTSEYHTLLTFSFPADREKKPVRLGDALAFQAGMRNSCAPTNLTLTEFDFQPAWSRSREFEITTRSADSSRMGLKTPTDQELEEDEEFGTADDDEQLVHGRRKRKVAFMPSPG